MENTRISSKFIIWKWWVAL